MIKPTTMRSSTLTPQDRQRRATGYSRFVARAKIVLPIVACVFFLLLTTWPYVSANLLQLENKVIGLKDAQIRDIRMVKPRFSGLDKDKHPYTITADAARENGGDANQSDPLIALEQPRADFVTKAGTWVVLSGKTGVYQSQAHSLDLFNDVTMLNDKGFHIITPSARIDLDSGGAEGHETVSGSGPSGTIQSEGFKSNNGGDVIFFTGKTRLVTNGATSKSE